jgi:hypothetical protein
MGPVLCGHLKNTQLVSVREKISSQMETHIAKIFSLPCKSEGVSRIGISHEGSCSRVGTTSESRVACTFVREGSDDLSDDTGIICSKRGVAGVNLTIDSDPTEESMGRNESCGEKWDK